MTLLRRLRREEGELGLVSALLLLAGVLLPIMFIVVAFARIENGRLAAAQAARDAVRAAVEAPTATGAQQAADDAIARAEMQSGPAPAPARRNLLPAAPPARRRPGPDRLRIVPFIGRLTIIVHGGAAAPVDTYRSLVAGNSP
jgi:hypothetical protein